MPTPHQIDEQIKHERAAIAQGLERLKENTKSLKKKIMLQFLCTE